MPLKKPWPRRIGFFAIGIFLAYLAGCFVLAQRYVSPNRLAAGVFPVWMVRSVAPGAGYGIPVWANQSLIAGSGSQAGFLLIHGYGGAPGRWTPLAERLKGHGDVVIVATRGQTVSPVRSVGFGDGEAEEIIEVARWMKGRGTKKMVVVGISMGGAAAWIAAARHPELFSAVVTEGAFARLDWASDEFLSVAIPHGDILAKPVVIFASLMSGRSPESVRPDLAAQSWRGKPGLVIHGGNDVLFSYRHPLALSEAAKVPIWEVPGAKHAGCIETAPDDYARRLIRLAEQ